MKHVLVLTLSLNLMSASFVMAEGGDWSLETLGEALFFDTDLSANGTLACASCHDPERAFTDPRETEVGRAVSLGDDDISLGDRNAPTLTYAALTPDFRRTESGNYEGGFFHDGRAASLEEQAAGPPLNPIEMAMPDRASIVDRLQRNLDYVAAFTTLFDPDIWRDPDAAFDAMTQAIAAFERTDVFAPFDSKYDRFLKGEIRLSAQEERGRMLFFDPDRTNCSLCHQAQLRADDRRETFTNYGYHNIGTPVNVAVREATGQPDNYVDRGLLEHPDVDHPAQAGRFKVPTLRNVAVTGPYMHNGVFEDLETVVRFYLKYTSFEKHRQINPATGIRWRIPEVPKTLAVSELIKGEDLSDTDVDSLVAFMRTLTDARYEHLLSD
ncbi:cytochrome c peroxidase [uncultured Shimia sp.]|uniref:cytochrome-c peroxidase n=1 Tax=uncultured Shimia sp. TaxID=573152 RepID=UPI0026058315|nr:cytochrome c peroxidase [uncultured Shimia sp.]